MRTLKNITILALLAFWYWGCESNNHQPETTVIYPVEPFTEVLINGVYEVDFVSDTSTYIIVKTNSAYQSAFDIAQDSFRLTISDDISLKYMRDLRLPKIQIHFTRMERLVVNGAPKIRNRDTLHLQKLTVAIGAESADVNLVLKANQLNFYNNYQSNGKYSFSGQVDRFRVAAQANIQLDARQLEAIEKSIAQNSVGDIYAGACSLLKVEITNRGNIFYSGAPQIDTLAWTSTGKLLYLP